MPEAAGHLHSGALINLFLRNCLNHSTETGQSYVEFKQCYVETTRTKFLSRRRTGCQASQYMLLAGSSPQNFSGSATIESGNLISSIPAMAANAGTEREREWESSYTHGWTW